MPIDFTLPAQFHGILSTIGWFDVLDILIVAAILYKVYEMLQDTRAITLVKGILVLLAVTMVCSWLDLHVISWLLQKTVTLLFVALPIVFQPELRRALEHLGQGRFLGSSALLDDEQDDVSATGIQIDGRISAEFLLNVFIVNTPLHDGATVIRGNRLIAAGCLLPLTENRTLSTELGTRHRAAIGLSEQCDALIVVVSEETGTISVAENGHIMRHLSPEYLKEVLMPAFEMPNTTIKDMVMNWRKKK